MPSYRYDQLELSTLLPSFINVGKATGSFTINGTVANGGSATFGTTLNVKPGVTFADVYVLNTTTKALITSVAGVGLTVYKPVSTETLENEIDFNLIPLGLPSGGSVIPNTCSLAVNVFNGTGADITLITQTITVEVIQYEIPF